MSVMAAAHLDSLGVQVAWVSGPWFLSIFVNVLPWESGMYTQSKLPFQSACVKQHFVLLSVHFS